MIFFDAIFKENFIWLKILYGSPPPHPPPQTLERIFLGVFYVVFGSVLWLYGRDSGGALC
jgi:hypothetical protein